MHWSTFSVFSLLVSVVCQELEPNGFFSSLLLAADKQLNYNYFVHQNFKDALLQAMR